MIKYYNTTESNALKDVSDNLCTITFTKKYDAPGHLADYIFNIIPK